MFGLIYICFKLKKPDGKFQSILKIYALINNLFNQILL